MVGEGDQTSCRFIKLDQDLSTVICSSALFLLALRALHTTHCANLHG